MLIISRERFVQARDSHRLVVITWGVWTWKTTLANSIGGKNLITDSQLNAYDDNSQTILFDDIVFNSIQRLIIKHQKNNLIFTLRQSKWLKVEGACNIHLSALRGNTDLIMWLFHNFLPKQLVNGFSREIWEVLTRYDWAKWNIRELKEVSDKIKWFADSEIQITPEIIISLIWKTRHKAQQILSPKGSKIVENNPDHQVEQPKPRQVRIKPAQTRVEPKANLQTADSKIPYWPSWTTKLSDPLVRVPNDKPDHQVEQPKPKQKKIEFTQEDMETRKSLREALAGYEYLFARLYHIYHGSQKFNWSNCRHYTEVLKIDPRIKNNRLVTK